MPETTLDFIREPEAEGYDFSISKIHVRAYKGARFLFNILGLNRIPFDNKPHQRAYMALYLMQEIMEGRPVSLSPEMSNHELFIRANHDFVEAVGVYKSLRKNPSTSLVDRVF